MYALLSFFSYSLLKKNDLLKKWKDLKIYWQKRVSGLMNIEIHFLSPFGPLLHIQMTSPQPHIKHRTCFFFTDMCMQVLY